MATASPGATAQLGRQRGARQHLSRPRATSAWTPTTSGRAGRRASRRGCRRSTSRPAPRLEVTEGGKLFVYGDQSSRPSTFRTRAPTVLLEAGTHRRSRPDRRRRPDGLGRCRRHRAGAPPPSPPTRATWTSPACRPPAPGAWSIGDTGRLTVDGRGVNLFSRYRIVVRGPMILTGQSYVAADHDTAVELRARTSGTGVGVLDLRNDGGIYEGIARDEPTLADVVNGGLILKRSGTGTSAITGDYSVVGQRRRGGAHRHAGAADRQRRGRAGRRRRVLRHRPVRQPGRRSARRPPTRTTRRCTGSPCPAATPTAHWSASGRASAPRAPGSTGRSRSSPAASPAARSCG